jgi:hypothetical protein
MQTQGQPRVRESLAPEVDVLFGSEKDLSLLSFVNFIPYGEMVTQDKVEWVEDTLPPEKFDFVRGGAGTDWDTTSATTNLPVATAQITKLKVGDVLQLPAGSGAEVVVVSSINVAGQTISVSKRGWGGTTATAQGASGTALIIGNAQVDGSDPIAETYTAPTERYNYVQIFEDSLAVSGKILRSKGLTLEGERARQRGLKLKRMISQLNYAMLNGVREKTGDVATFQGLRNVASSTYNVNGALTVAKVYAMVTQMMSAGAFPQGIHGSPVGISRIEQLFTTFKTEGPSKANANLTVTKLNIMGIEIELHIDKHMLDTEFLLLDYSRITKHVQETDPSNPGGFSAYVLTNNGKQYKEQLVGYYTLKQVQASASVVRAYGCTS